MLVLIENAKGIVKNNYLLPRSYQSLDAARNTIKRSVFRFLISDNQHVCVNNFGIHNFGIHEIAYSPLRLISA